MQKINLKNNSSNCYVYVIFECLFSNFFRDFYIFEISEQKKETPVFSKLINHVVNISYHLKNQNPDLLSLNYSVNELRNAFEGKLDQDDAGMFFNKLCKLIKSEHPNFFDKYYGMKVNDGLTSTFENIILLTTYDNVKWLDQKYTPEYICLGTDILEKQGVATIIYHGKHTYFLESMIFYYGNGSGGHWNCYKKENNKWYVYDNLYDTKREINFSLRIMPKIIIFKKTS